MAVRLPSTATTRALPGLRCTPTPRRYRRGPRSPSLKRPNPRARRRRPLRAATRSRPLSGRSTLQQRPARALRTPSSPRRRCAWPPASRTMPRTTTHRRRLGTGPAVVSRAVGSLATPGPRSRSHARCGHWSQSLIWRRPRSQGGSPRTSSPSTRISPPAAQRCSGLYLLTPRPAPGGGRARAGSAPIHRSRTGSTGARMWWCSSRSSCESRPMRAPAHRLTPLRRPRVMFPHRPGCSARRALPRRPTRPGSPVGRAGSG